LRRDLAIKAQRTETTQFVRLAILLVIIGGIFIFGLRSWFIDFYVMNISNQAICFDQGGNWILWSAECESYRAHADVFADVCEGSGGTYEGCLSQCRNQVNADVRICDAPCVNVCQY
jgi:hypothetical protein